MRDECLMIVWLLYIEIDTFILKKIKRYTPIVLFLVK